MNERKCYWKSTIEPVNSFDNMANISVHLSFLESQTAWHIFLVGQENPTAE